VLFSDLVGSTAVSARMDPEDLREVIAAYQKCVAETVRRGWDNFLQVGVSEAPHGGFGFLHFRNVLSNYFAFRDSGELGQDIAPWMFDGKGTKNPALRHQPFMAVQYMDLHILKPECGMGSTATATIRRSSFCCRGPESW
jgi:hypothetical protein